MNMPKIRAGIVGLGAGQGWAAVAHLPALRALHEKFEIVGVANSRLESSQAAANAHGIPRAFANAANMAASPDIDLLVVTTRVPQHFDVVKAALEAGKHVYCEWPLGRTLEEAIELADLARSKGVLAVTGTQARVSPAVRKLQQLVADGSIGQIVSTNISGYVGTWGPTIGDLANERYLREWKNGANLLTIPFGHTVSAIRDVLGDIASVSAVLETRHKQVLATETGAYIPADAPDHILVAGMLTSGAPITIHYAGGMPPDGNGFIWDIRGTAGHIRVIGPHGYSQIAELAIMSNRDSETGLHEIQLESDPFQSLGLVAGNVARIYERTAEDLHYQTQTAPSFSDAVMLHRVLHAIEDSAQQGMRVVVDAPNRLLPESRKTSA